MKTFIQMCFNNHRIYGVLLFRASDLRRFEISIDDERYLPLLLIVVKHQNYFFEGSITSSRLQSY